MVNKEINGNQCTIVWWVDDLKISHKDSRIVDEVLKLLKSKYDAEDIGVMSPSRGKVHEFLGMKLDYSKKGKVMVDMPDFVKKMAIDFKKYMAKMQRVSSPEAPYLFEVRENVENVCKEKAEVLHNMTACGVFLTKKSVRIHPHSNIFSSNKSERVGCRRF